MQLDDALSRISEIHAHVVKSEVFRGYHAGTAAVTGGLALLAAVLQNAVAPPGSASDFALFWLAIAPVAFGLAGRDLLRAWLAAERSCDRRRTAVVLGQLLPPLFCGGAVTAILLTEPAPHAALLPGLWSIVSGLTLFAARPHLPRATLWVAIWFALAGAWLLADPLPIAAPWDMGLTFGIGMLALAAVLRLDLARSSHGDAR